MLQASMNRAPTYGGFNARLREQQSSENAPVVKNTSDRSGLGSLFCNAEL
jgi:hypothetical protein